MIIYYTEEIEYHLGAIRRGLRRELGEHAEIGGRMQITPEAYDPERDQYDASWLLGHLLSRTDGRALWVVHSDLFVDGMNYVFGYASIGRGAIISTYRLPSEEMVVKEAVHEAGHVLGLKHCKNQCVMQFSDTLGEAERKPGRLCNECQRRLAGERR